MAALDTFTTPIGAINFIAPEEVDYSNYKIKNIDRVIERSTPESIALIQQGFGEQGRLTRDAIKTGIQPLQQFADPSAYLEQQALLGTLGADEQRAAIEGINLTAAQAEADQTQQEALRRSLAATGDIGSGYGIQSAQRLGGAQVAQRVQDRLSQLEPLAQISRSVRNTISELEEAGGQRLAQQSLSRGGNLSSIRLGAGAQAAQSALQKAELEGLQGIAQQQQQSGALSSAVGLLGQATPAISNWAANQGITQMSTQQALANAPWEI